MVRKGQSWREFGRVGWSGGGDEWRTVRTEGVSGGK